MARSHHRKKHKEHVRQFKQVHDTAVSTATGKSKSSATWVFGIAGLIVGFAVGYFASSGEMIWMAAGAVAGIATGYFIGRKIDSDKK
ncbi:MAG TPA: SoxR reducing system RseC family protein [Chitinophagaceae bacterium]|nr:SoxR reducing system RseC family protein [Chitinophagaceae bacterium]